MFQEQMLFICKRHVLGALFWLLFVCELLTLAILAIFGSKNLSMCSLHYILFLGANVSRFVHYSKRVSKLVVAMF